MPIPLSNQERRLNLPEAKQASAVRAKLSTAPAEDATNLSNAIGNLATQMYKNSEQTKADALYTEYFNAMSELNKGFLETEGKQTIDARNELNRKQEALLAKTKEQLASLSPEMQYKLKGQLSEANNQFKASNSGHLLKQTRVYEDAVHKGKMDADARAIAQKAQNMAQAGMSPQAIQNALSGDIEDVFNESMSYYTNRGLPSEYSANEAIKELSTSMTTVTNTLATNIGNDAALAFLDSDLAKKNMAPEIRGKLLSDYEKNKLGTMVFNLDPRLFKNGEVNKKYLNDNFKNLTDYEKAMVIRENQNANNAKLTEEQKNMIKMQAEMDELRISEQLNNLGIDSISTANTSEEISDAVKKVKTASGGKIKITDLLDMQQELQRLWQNPDISKAASSQHDYFFKMHKKLQNITNAITSDFIKNGPSASSIVGRNFWYDKDASVKETMYWYLLKTEYNRTKKGWWPFRRNEDFNPANVNKLYETLMFQLNTPNSWGEVKDKAGNTIGYENKSFTELIEDEVPDGKGGVTKQMKQFNYLPSELSRFLHDYGTEGTIGNLTAAQAVDFQRFMVNYMSISNNKVLYSNAEVDDALKKIRQSDPTSAYTMFMDRFDIDKDDNIDEAEFNIAMRESQNEKDYYTAVYSNPFSAAAAGSFHTKPPQSSRKKLKRDVEAERERLKKEKENKK